MEDDINEQNKLLNIYLSNLTLFMSQRDKIGDAYIPPSLFHGINDSYNAVMAIIGKITELGGNISDNALAVKNIPFANRSIVILQTAKEKFYFGGRVKTIYWAGSISSKYTGLKYAIGLPSGKIGTIVTVEKKSLIIKWNSQKWNYLLSKKEVYLNEFECPVNPKYLQMMENNL